jgi:hypothetical protein
MLGAFAAKRLGNALFICIISVVQFGFNVLHKNMRLSVMLSDLRKRSIELRRNVVRVCLLSPVVTICTTRFNIQQFHVLPTQCIYVFCVDLRTNSDYFPIQH